LGRDDLVGVVLLLLLVNLEVKLLHLPKVNARS
jgi:hypothetical protein